MLIYGEVNEYEKTFKIKILFYKCKYIQCYDTVINVDSNLCKYDEKSGWYRLVRLYILLTPADRYMRALNVWTIKFQ